ncbi:MAG TPA: hypothetical protein VFG48_04010 [Xanthomonadales bacterium]|nr:hypothetical protein [Xanthomonadales bacterium]
MKRWLEDNPVGQALAAVAGGLVAAMLLLGVVWSLPPAAGEADGASERQALRVEVPQLPESEPVESFAVVTDRPVFNESRQPELEADAAGEGEGESADELAETPVDAPEVELAGVIITPTLRMVTLRPKEGRESLVAFEGQPLQGDYGSWHVSRIAPREITLAAGDGRELQLQLQVHDAQIKPPPKPSPPPEQVAQEQAAEDGEDGEPPMTRAEEIRQRIAERREELRRAAEEEESGEKPVSDYQTAIRSMIGAKRKPKENENDQ